MDESGYFRDHRHFTLANKDLLLRIRNDVAHLHLHHSDRYEHTIPLMDRYGRLLFEQEEIDKVLSSRAR